MKRAILFFLLTTSILGYGQQGIDKTNMSSIPRLELPILDNNKLVSKELKSRDVIGRAPEFAQPCKVDAGCHQSGQWMVDGDRARWQMRVKSTGAKSLNFGFTEFYMPTSASFYMTGVTSGQRRGPFVSSDNDPHDQFWSPIIEDEEVLLELEVDTDQKDFVRLHLSKVNHGYFKFGSKHFSASCNLDVICSDADGWGVNNSYRDIIRSVVMYSLNGTQACTGMLINNIREDGTPYIMTADHCGISSTNASTMVTYYNYENTTCRQPESTASESPGNGSLATFNTGATWISATPVGSGTDFNLVQLDDPINPAANAFISGWNREDIAPSAGIAIHHPNTEEKRISYENDPLQISRNGGENTDPDGKYLRIVDWDTGTTEPGSSGSPLFDPEQRFIGQLYGGGAACGNNESDYYGRLASSWEGSGSPTSRAKDHLDPDSVKPMKMDGMEASAAVFHSKPDQYLKEVCKPTNLTYSITTNTNFTGSVTYSVIHNPLGATVTIQPMNANPGDEVNITISNTSSLALGLHGLRIKTEDTAGNAGETQLWYKVQDAIPSSLTLIEPTNGSEYQVPTPKLQWEDLGVSYELEVSKLNTFTSTIANETIKDETHWVVDSDLEPNTQYYWRVRGVTSCENGAWSSVFSFTTGDVPNCSIVHSTDVPKIIDEPQAGVITSNIIVTDLGRIASVSVTKIRGSHSFISDLSFTLISPSGTEVLLLADLCSAEENFDVGFADSGSSNNLPCPYIDGLIYVPAEPLSVLIGESAEGTWILKVTDSADQDGGQLEEWNIEVCTVRNIDDELTLSRDKIVACGIVDETVLITAESGFSGPVTLSIVNPIDGITTSFDQATITAESSTNLTITGSLTQNETIIVRATDGNIEANKSIILQLPPSPTAVNLTSPIDMAMDIPNNVSFEWQASENTNAYRYQIATDNSFATIVGANTIIGTAETANIAIGGTYFWRVLSINDCDTTISSIRQFSIPASFNVSIDEPMIKTCMTDVSYLVNVNSGAEGAVTATLNDAPAGSVVTYENNPATEGQTIKVILSNIPTAAEIYDMTIGLADDQESTSIAVQLEVKEAPSSAPTLISPANNGGEVDTLPSFEMTLVDNALSYILEVATDVGFQDVIISSSSQTDGLFEPNERLEHNTRYYWRVQAINDCGISFSPIYQFMTLVGTDVTDVFQSESIILAPNPTSLVSEIIIQSTSYIRGGYVIYNIDGRVLSQGNIDRSRTRLDTSTLAKGIYLVRIHDENAFVVKKLIIF